MIKEDNPFIVLDLLSQEENALLEKYFDKTARKSPHVPTHRCALGYSDFRVAASIGIDRPAARPTSNPEDNAAIELLGQVYVKAKTVLEKHYGVEMAMVQASYTEYVAGPGQALHSDMHYSDGTIRDDGVSIHMKYSAVLYLTSGGGVDFSGGDLYFPDQDYRHVPLKASLIYFMGDMGHRHVVEDIESGIRKGLTMFYGIKDEVWADMA